MKIYNFEILHNNDKLLKTVREHKRKMEKMKVKIWLNLEHCP